MKLVLTSKEILNKEFSITARGYDATEVDTFLDKVLNDYRMIDSVVKALNSQINQLKKENEKLRKSLNSKEAEINENYNNLQVSTGVNRLDNLDLLRKISKYEKKLYQMGVDPSKIK